MVAVFFGLIGSLVCFIVILLWGLVLGWFWWGGFWWCGIGLRYGVVAVCCCCSGLDQCLRVVGLFGFGLFVNSGFGDDFVHYRFSWGGLCRSAVTRCRLRLFCCIGLIASCWIVSFGGMLCFCPCVLLGW